MLSATNLRSFTPVFRSAQAGEKGAASLNAVLKPGLLFPPQNLIVAM